MRRLTALALVLGTLHTVPASALVWPNAVARAEKALRSDDVAERRRAAATLSRLPDASARRLAVHALSDDDVDVRLMAVSAAEALRVEGLGRKVIGWLSESDSRLRRAAAWALRLDPTPEANAALARSLSDADVSVRLAAAEALGDVESDAATLPLLGRLDDTHPDVRLAVVRALGRGADAKAVVPLIGKAQDNVADVRREVARALASLGDVRAVPALVLQLGDREPSVRTESLRALGRLRAEDAVAAIGTLLEQERRSAVRAPAFDALGRIANAAALDALLQWLGREEDDGRDVVADALAAAGEPAVERLRSCLLGQPLPDVADGCARALAKSGQPGVAAQISSALGRGVVRPEAALRALALAGDRHELPTVLEQLGAADPAVRDASMEAASALLDPARPEGRAIGPLAEALERAMRDRRERIVLVALLGRTGSPRAAPFIIPLLADADDASLRRVAARALGWVRARSATDALLRALDDADPDVRLEAAVSLGRSPAKGTAAKLLVRYESAPRQDRVAVAIALAGAASLPTPPAFVHRVGALVRQKQDAERDALIDVLAATPGAEGVAALSSLLASGVDPATRAKIAEALTGHARGSTALWQLADDVDGAVRANAVWALGSVAVPSDLPRLVSHLDDRDPAVSGNAAAALALLGLRGADARPNLCAATTHRHPYVRANAVRGLSMLGTRCDPTTERRMLARDPSAIVRAAVATLLMGIPRAQRERQDVDALARCAADEPDGAVAATCIQDPERPGEATGPLTIYVVPEGQRHPVPRAPFALVRPDGLMRLGLADRRGVVREAKSPRGELRLEVPAPLALP